MRQPGSVAIESASACSLDHRAPLKRPGGAERAFFKPTNQYATQESYAGAYTGPQSNITEQLDSDYIMAGPGAGVINVGGNKSLSHNAAAAKAVSVPVIGQFA